MQQKNQTIKIETSKPKTSKKSKCEFRLPNENESKYTCPFEKYDANKPFCVFHIPKTTEEAKKTMGSPQITYYEKIEEKFIKKFYEILNSTEFNTGDFLDFRGFHFPKIEFPPISFSKKANFSYSIFYNEINFSTEVENPNPEHQYDTHRALLLSKGAEFSNVNFKANAIFVDVEVYDDFEFQNVVFEGDTLFNRFTSKKFAEFRDVSFNGISNFGGANFERIGFYNITFSKEAIFASIEINSSIELSQITFNQEAIFDNARLGKENIDDINKKENLDNAEYDDSSFLNIVFNERVSFSSVVFFRFVQFVDVIFRKQADFISYDEGNREIERAGMFQSGCAFIRVTPPKDEECIFFRTVLSKASFHDTNVEKIVFRDVEWAMPKTKFQKLFRGKAFLLWDEIRDIKQGTRDWLDDAKTAENYRQLVLNYESKRDYETAEFFHIGEMEMRRKKNGNNYSNSFWHLIKKYLNGYGLYCLSSRYGTSYKQAFLVLLVLIFIFSFLFLFTGIQTGKEVNTADKRIVEYNLFPDLHHKPNSIMRFLSDYKETISFTFSIITFQRERFYEPLGWQSRFLLYSAVLVLTAQSALLLLAIRRQFRRE